MSNPAPLLEVNNLKVHYPIRSGLLSRVTGHVRAVNDVRFTLGPSETLGIVGESGCGKSTLGRTLVRLEMPTEGAVRINGHDIHRLGGADLRKVRGDIQMVFQDPFASINPRHRVSDIIGAPLRIHGRGSAAERREQVAELMAQVGLRPDQAENFPHQFSGGQRQRIGIARALALHPKVIVCDEPVSALDVSIQAQILNLMKDLQERLGLSYVFISHDLGVVQHVSHRIAVMYLGHVVELAERKQLYAMPKHPYTQMLMQAAPVEHPRQRNRTVVSAVPPGGLKPYSGTGCAFVRVCPIRKDHCFTQRPPLTKRDDGRLLACHER